MMLETSVRTHPKFLAAGPEAAWLWVCGLSYCQDGLTDGFIPESAIEYLGVKRARSLAKKLVSVGLWEHVSGGWQLHDYLEHNKPAAEVREIMRLRKEGGKKGGRPPKPSAPKTENLQGLPPTENPENLPGNPLLDCTTGTTRDGTHEEQDQDQNKSTHKSRRDLLPVENSVENSAAVVS